MAGDVAVLSLPRKDETSLSVGGADKATWWHGRLRTDKTTPSVGVADKATWRHGNCPCHLGTVPYVIFAKTKVRMSFLSF